MNRGGREGPSARRRYVRRAQWLKEDPAFHRAMAQSIADWNQNHPDFAVLARGYPPVDEDYRYPDFQTIMPHSLQERWKYINHPSRVCRDPTDAEWPILEAVGDWNDLVGRLCLEWWPPEIFPNWINPLSPLVDHPAMFFVAGCLVWQPRAVPEEWILRISMLIRLDSDPRFPAAHPEVIFWRTRVQEILDGLQAALRDGQGLTADLLMQVKQQAKTAAEAARQQAEQNGPSGRWCLLLYPGLISSDLRDDEKTLIDLAGESGISLSTYARDLKANGKSVYAIARVLGLSPRQAGRLLEDP